MLITVSISLLLHLLVLLDVFFSQQPLIQPNQQPTKTIEVVMSQPQQEEDQPPPPEHNEDDPTKANNQSGLAKQKKAKKPKATTANETKVRKKQSPAPQKTESIVPEPKQPSQMAKLKAIFGEDLEVSESNGNEEITSNELDEAALDDTLVESPLNEDEEALRRWYNEVYKRLSAQVAQVWIKPDGSSEMYRGVIRLNIDLQGYLNSAWIHLPSGDRALDQSALMAVKSIIRYQLPESPNMARYYQNLEFRYSGG